MIWGPLTLRSKKLLIKRNDKLYNSFQKYLQHTSFVDVSSFYLSLPINHCFSNVFVLRHDFLRWYISTYSITIYG